MKKQVEYICFIRWVIYNLALDSAAVVCPLKQTLKIFHLSFDDLLSNNFWPIFFMVMFCCPENISVFILKCQYNNQEWSVFSRFALLCARFLLFIALLTWLFSQGGDV